MCQMKSMIKAILAVLIIIFLTSIVLPAAASEPALNGIHILGASDGNQNSTEPAEIELRAERSHVTADDVDNIWITAFVYDSQGNLVADGYKINFTIGDATSNSFMGIGGFNYVPGAQGRLGSLENSNNFDQCATRNNSGSASVQFGWIDAFYGGNNSTIWAYSADNASVYASIKIYSAAPMASWSGYVVDLSGAGLGGINVKMHVMCMNGSTPYEIYNMTRITSSSPPSVGYFAFGYIVMQGVAYGYVDAEARLTDNQTVYGKSDNFSLNRSATSIGNITLGIQPPKATMPSPSATAKPTPGFEALFALAGSIGMAYLITRKKD